MSTKVDKKTKFVEVMTIEDEYESSSSTPTTTSSGTKKRGGKKGTGTNAAIMNSYKKTGGKGKKRGPKGARAVSSAAAVKQSELPGQYKEPHLGNGQVNDSEWLVEEVVGKKIDGGIIYYFIKWQDWSSSANTWEPVDNLGGCEDMINDFEKAESAKRKLNAPTWNTNTDLTLGNNGFGDPQTNDELDEKYGVVSNIPKDKEIDEIMSLIVFNEELCFLVKWKTTTTTTTTTANGDKVDKVEVEAGKEESVLELLDDNGVPVVGSNVNIVRNHIMKLKFPQELINFYEARIKFDPVEEDSDLADDKMILAIKANDILGQSAEIIKQGQDTAEDNMEDNDDQMDITPIFDNNNEGKNVNLNGAEKTHIDQYGLPLILDGQDDFGSESLSDMSS